MRGWLKEAGASYSDISIPLARDIASSSTTRASVRRTECDAEVWAQYRKLDSRNAEPTTAAPASAKRKIKGGLQRWRLSFFIFSGGCLQLGGPEEW